MAVEKFCFICGDPGDKYFDFEAYEGFHALYLCDFHYQDEGKKAIETNRELFQRIVDGNVTRDDIKHSAYSWLEANKKKLLEIYNKEVEPKLD